MRNSLHTTRGFGLVEIIIGASILSVSLFSLSKLFQATLRDSVLTQGVTQGDYLLEEGIEGAKILRDTSYSSSFGKMSTTTSYYLSWTGTTWATSTTNTLIDGKFDRKINLSDVKRDSGTSDIAAAGTYDPNTKLVTVAVSWRDSTGTTTRSIQSYITNIFNN